MLNNKNQVWPCAYFGSWNSLRLPNGWPLKSTLSFDCSVQGKVFFHADFFWRGGSVHKAIHIDNTGPPLRAAPPRTPIAERQPRGLMVSTHQWRWHWTSLFPSLRFLSLLLCFKRCQGYIFALKSKDVLKNTFHKNIVLCHYIIYSCVCTFLYVNLWMIFSVKNTYSRTKPWWLSLFVQDSLTS